MDLKLYLIRFIFLLMIASLGNRGDAQSRINYLDIRDSVMTLGCGRVDSNAVYGSLRRLDKLDPAVFIKNVDVYYTDLATCYWMASGGRDERLLQRAVELNLNALYHNAGSTRSMNDLAFCYAALKDCPKSMYYLDLYKRNLPEKYLGDSFEKTREELKSMCH